jgi:hypothetical protein
MNEKILKIPYSAVNNDWDFLQKYLKAIGNPKYIIVGNVNLIDKKDIFDLGNLVGVEGYLNLDESSIESLGDLEFVDGDLCLWGCKNIKTLGKLKRVEGGLDIDPSIESLGDLEFVNGDSLNLSGCKNIKTLGNLKKFVGYLNLSWSSIESLGELEYVEGSFNLSNCKKIKTLGKLKRVEGILVLSNSNIESLGDLQFIGINLYVNETNIPQSEINKVEVVGRIFIN